MNAYLVYFSLNLFLRSIFNNDTLLRQTLKYFEHFKTNSDKNSNTLFKPSYTFYCGSDYKAIKESTHCRQNNALIANVIFAAFCKVRYLHTQVNHICLLVIYESDILHLKKIFGHFFVSLNILCEKTKSTTRCRLCNIVLSDLRNINGQEAGAL